MSHNGALQSAEKNRTTKSLSGKVHSKSGAICSINVPMKLNGSVNLICCSLNVWFYCVWHFIIFFRGDKHLLKNPWNQNWTFMAFSVIIYSFIWEKGLKYLHFIRFTHFTLMGLYTFLSNQMLLITRLSLSLINLSWLAITNNCPCCN